MTRNLNKLLILFAASIILLSSGGGFAETIHVQQGKIIQHTIYLFPGFAAMMQFPEDIMSMDLADPRIAYCERSKVDAKSALCKPKVYDQYSTNLIVTTNSNKFNLTMTVSSNKNNTTDIISFAYRKAVPKTASNRPSHLQCPPRNQSVSLLDNIMSGFKIANFRRSAKSDFARLRTDKIMIIGNDVYLTFFVENNNYSSFDILKADVYLEKLGGMTGMSIQSEKIVPTEYRLSRHSIRTNEETFGVVKFKKIFLNEDQSLSLRISERTDKRKDIYFRFDLGE